MKTCPGCFSQIPPELLVCEACIRRKAVAELHGQQAQYLEKVVAGLELLRVGCTARGDRHILLFTSGMHTFCGRELTGTIRRSRLATVDLHLACTACAKVVQKAIAELP